MDKQTYLKQLKHREPVKRKEAIKAAARATDRDALVQLAIMCEDDPDAEVRELALRAGGFIRKQTSETPTNGKGAGHIAVSEDVEKRAYDLINAALTLQSAKNNGKAMKTLSQALSINPNLRHDPYFINVAETVTGRPGEGAAVIALLDNKNEQKTITQKENQERSEQEIAQHVETVNKVTWSSAVFDVLLFFVVMFIGTLLVLFMTVNSAQRYIQKIDDNIAAVNAARAEGRVVNNGSKEVFLTRETDSAGNPSRFEAIEYDLVFWRQANALQRTEFVTLVPIAGGTAFGADVLLVLFCIITHFMGALVLRGKGKAAYLTNQLLSLMSGRMVALFIVMGIGVIIAMDSGGGTMITLVSGVVGIMALIFSFNLIALTAKSYHFGFVKGLIATIPGWVLVGAVATTLIGVL